MYQFSFQIMHHPLRFTGMGLFRLGNNFLRKVYFYTYTIFCYFIFFLMFYIINYRNLENYFIYRTLKFISQTCFVGVCSARKNKYKKFLIMSVTQLYIQWKLIKINTFFFLVLHENCNIHDHHIANGLKTRPRKLQSNLPCNI